MRSSVNKGESIKSSSRKTSLPCHKRLVLKLKQSRQNAVENDIPRIHSLDKHVDHLQLEAFLASCFEVKFMEAVVVTEK
jgi:hypothetical protein